MRVWRMRTGISITLKPGDRRRLKALARDRNTPHKHVLSVVDLQAAINRFVIEHNAKPKPFTWTADPDKIIQAVRRGHQVLDSIHWEQPRGCDYRK
jgi:hypothetical protein